MGKVKKRRGEKLKILEDLTLIELMIIVVVIGIIASVAIPKIVGFKKSENVYNKNDVITDFSNIGKEKEE